LTSVQKVTVRIANNGAASSRQVVDFTRMAVRSAERFAFLTEPLFHLQLPRLMRSQPLPVSFGPQNLVNSRMAVLTTVKSMKEIIRQASGVDGNAHLAECSSGRSSTIRPVGLLQALQLANEAVLDLIFLDDKAGRDVSRAVGLLG
jgi:hypothetical protein